MTYEEVKAVYDKYYDKEYFVRVLNKDVCPQTRWVEGKQLRGCELQDRSENKADHYDGVPWIIW